MLIKIETIKTTQISMMKYDKLENKLVGISATLSAEMITSITVAKQTVYAKIVIAE